MNSVLPSEFCFIERGWLNANNVIVHAHGAPAIVDTGHLYCADETIDLIRANGFDPTEIGQIAITHAHSDHHGGNRKLMSLSGAPVAMGSLTAEWFARGERHLTWFDQMSQEVDVIPADIIYHEGDIVDLGGMPFQVVSLPGHGMDTVGYFQPDTRVMICADAMWHNDTGMLHTQVHGWDIIDDAELALRRIAELDVAVAIPGHGGLITNVAECTDNALQRLQSFRKEPARLAWHIIRRFYVYGVLRYQPILASEYQAQVLDDSWLAYYCNIINESADQGRQYSPLQLANRLLDEFKARDIVREEDGFLSCDLRR